MMVVDASAIVAILLNEPEREQFYEMLLATPAVLSPVGYWEAAVRVGGVLGPDGRKKMDTLLEHLSVVVMPATGQTANVAVEAQKRFGKRTSAKLNLGDCFAYALAREQNAPLLYKGDDFGRTDVVSALAN